jgi:hypothetical protein
MKQFRSLIHNSRLGQYLTPCIHASVSAKDNKERIYYNGIGGYKALLTFRGNNITAYDEGCGDRTKGRPGMKIHYAYIIEDADRDDANGPCEPFTTGCPNESTDVWGVDPEDFE